MMSAPAIALYLGESYASLGAFDLGQKEIFEKSVFLPQVSLKNLLLQTKAQLAEHLTNETPLKFFIVSKYLDRLKNFRLGGSVMQVVQAGFENSYSLANTKSLSLAAASLVISLSPETLTEEILTTELARIKKINSDTNKVVIQLSEKYFSPTQLKMVHDFFSNAEFSVFTCTHPENLDQVRRALLNAGAEGTKEEVISDVKEIFDGPVEIYFWCGNVFKTSFENHELFGSSNSFLASLAQSEKADAVAYFDHEGFRFIQTEAQDHWVSPWGAIPTANHQMRELRPHPFSEIRLDHLSMLSISQQPTQHEPGPVCAGRGIKPLVLDLFSEEIAELPLTKSLFTQFHSDLQRQKLESHLSVIEKGQAETPFKVTRDELKKNIIDNMKYEISLQGKNKKLKVMGPLAPLFGFKNSKFNWPQEILKKALV